MPDTSLHSSDREAPPSMPYSEASAWVAAKRAEIGAQFDNLHRRLGFTEDIALHPLCKLSTREIEQHGNGGQRYLTLRPGIAE